MYSYTATCRGPGKKPRRFLQSLLYKLNRRTGKRAIQLISDAILPFLVYFAAHKSHSVKVMQFLEQSLHIHLVWYPRFCLNLVEQSLQKPCTVGHSYRNIPFTKIVKEELSNQAALHCTSVDSQKGFENVANLPRYKLM